MDGSKTLYPPQLVAWGIKTVSWKSIPDLEDSFLRQMFMISINHPFASRDICIHFGKKTWSHLRGYTFTDFTYTRCLHRVFRVGGSCNFPSFCAHFLLPKISTAGIFCKFKKNYSTCRYW